MWALPLAVPARYLNSQNFLRQGGRDIGSVEYGLTSRAYERKELLSFHTLYLTTSGHNVKHFFGGYLPVRGGSERADFAQDRS